MVNDKKYYLFFDEIQNVERWEKVVNSLKVKHGEKVSVFITGSNSDLLSGKLAIYLAGRYVSFKIYPFTFKEVCQLKGIEDKNRYELEECFNDYIRFGAFDLVRDHYPKYVISTDKFDMSQNGVIHKNIINFLLER